MVSFFAVTSIDNQEFERTIDGLKGETADIIRLMGPVSKTVFPDQFNNSSVMLQSLY